MNDRLAMVEKASNGSIGYLHVQAMNAPSFRKFDLDLADNRFKKDCGDLLQWGGAMRRGTLWVGL